MSYQSPRAFIEQKLKFKRLGIHTGKSAVVYVSENCELFKVKGFDPGIRVRVNKAQHFIIASLHVVKTSFLKPNEVSLSQHGIQLLALLAGEVLTLSYPDPLKSLGYIRKKAVGKELTQHEIETIVKDVSTGRLSGIHLASFLTACTGDRLSETEITFLTQAMVDVGKRLIWSSDLVVDKHCIGGLPGNRTTLIVVPIVAAFGLTIPKSSSRSITSSAGTADTMEVLAPVDLTLSEIKRVVEQEKGCIVWGGASDLSPADDVFIGVERILDIDSPGQFVSSILSKKVAAGSNHLVIDIPVGPTAKVRSQREAKKLKGILEVVGQNLGLTMKVFITDGRQPVGYGIGAALEARDVLAVLKNERDAHPGLRERALFLAGHLLEFSEQVKKGTGNKIARKILESGEAWKKFQAICKAQGGMKTPPVAIYQRPIVSFTVGQVMSIDNRRLAQLAKLAGAPQDKSAGVDIRVSIGDTVKKGTLILTLHAESEGELKYAFDYLDSNMDIVVIQ